MIILRVLSRISVTGIWNSSFGDLVIDETIAGYLHD